MENEFSNYLKSSQEEFQWVLNSLVKDKIATHFG